MPERRGGGLRARGRWLIAWSLIGCAHAADAPRPLEWYVPPSAMGFDARIPRPETVLDHPVGARIAAQEQIVAWFEALAAASERVTLLELGDTHEGRRQIVAVISAPRHVDDLDRVRLKRTDDEPTAPLVSWHGFGTHGDEPGGVQAALITAWYLAADTSPATAELLERIVVMIDPLQNPDGYVRFSRWVNAPGNGGAPTVLGAPPEPWPGGMGNHYMFDLSADWLSLQQPETRNRARLLLRHAPDLITDHHEAIDAPGARHLRACGARELDGGDAEDPATWLTERMRDEVASSDGAAVADPGLRSQDSVAIATETFHWAELQGAVGLSLTAVAARDGDAASLIRRQVGSVLDALHGAREFEQALKAWRAADRGGRFLNDPGPAAWLIGDGGDGTRAGILLDVLKTQGLEVFGLLAAIERDGVNFAPGHGWVVPAYGRRGALARALLAEGAPADTSCRSDGVALAAAMGLPGIELADLPIGLDTTNRVAREPPGGGRDAAAWVLGASDFLAPAVLHRLKGAGVPVRVAREPFVIGDAESFPAGSIVVRRSELPRLRIPAETFLARIVRGDTPVAAVSRIPGIEGPGFVELQPSRAGLVAGEGVSTGSAGAHLHLLEQRLGIAVTPVRPVGFSADLLGRLTHLVVPDGDYQHVAAEDLRILESWVLGGGVLIAVAGAAQMAQSRGWLEDAQTAAEYELRVASTRLRLAANTALGYGLADAWLRVPDRHISPLAATGGPAIQVARLGDGVIVAFASDPLDGAIWLGGGRLVANALSFGEVLRGMARERTPR